MFKSLDQILEADERHRYFVTSDLRRMTLQLHHADVARVTLKEGAPDEVRQMFDRARNAFVYSWFDYDLGGLAELLAFGALEQALKSWAGVAPGKSSPGLHNLYQLAVDRGLYPKDPPPPALPTAKLMASVRNEWAHGSMHVHDPGMVLTVLRMCADRINVLFNAAATTAATSAANVP